MKGTPTSSFLILASGSGTNAKALMETARKHDINLIGVFSDKKDSAVLNKAKELDYPIFYSESSDSKSCFEYLNKLIDEKKPNWLLLAGFMKILPESILKNFFNQNLQQYQVVNIHPSLLPKYPGMNSYKQAFENKDEETGISIHFVDEGVDTGKIIEQHKFPIKHLQKLDDVIETGKKIENKVFPELLIKLHSLSHEELKNELSL